MIHFPEKINSVERETKGEGIAAFRPIKYATIISVRGQARTMIAPVSRCFMSYLDTGRENGKFSVRKLMLTWRDRVTSRFIKYATIISARSRTRSRLPIFSSREPAPFLRNLTNHQLVRSDARPRYAGLCSISGFSNFFNNWDLVEFASSWMWFVIFEMRIRIFRIKNLIFFVLWRKKYLWQVFFFFF